MGVMMVKVLIADDEERICRLICALVDWESLGLEVAGIAHNGIEAVKMVEEVEPDILITDIRMPGCSGLELIEKTKQTVRDLEIVIISGYAHFDYAQQAIRFGVGDYLLKPINRAELNATLKKLKERICQRRESQQDERERQEKEQKDARRLQLNLLERLCEQESPELSRQILKDTYHLQVKPGLFQAFWLKMDCGSEQFGDAPAAVLMAKAQEELERGLRDKCTELVLAVKGFSCIGIMNYPREHQEEIRRSVKSCLNQLELQKSLFRPVTFSAALGCAGEVPGMLGQSMKEAAILIQERLLKGTGRMFERMVEPSSLQQREILERYLREIAQAAETLDQESSRQAVRLLDAEVRQVKDVRGCEAMELVKSAAEVFAVRIQMQERQERLAQFAVECDRCGSLDEIFDCLLSLQNEQIAMLAQQRENDAVRPIRRAKQYIQAHYSEPITLEEVSSTVGLSTAYFSVLFKKTEGEGFAKYLINVRMEQAKILLRESNMPVAEVCRRVGYNDLKHFTHTFEKATGVKPATYRKLYG